MFRLKLGLLLLSVGCLAVILSGCGGAAPGIGSEPSFTLSPSPSSVKIAQGDQSTSTVTIAPVNGFSGNVTLSASGLPSGVTAALRPSSATTGSTLTLTASPTATTGTTTLTITGTSGTVANITALSLFTTSQQSGNGKINHVVIIFQENRSPD